MITAAVRCRRDVDRFQRFAQGDEGWSFAAPASIHSAIVEDLPTAISERIVEHVKSDLVNIEAAALPSHFRSLQPI
ncbi:MAG: hypothetical protein ABI795_01845 [Chthoniobacterales bacterium]